MMVEKMIKAVMVLKMLVMMLLLVMAYQYTDGLVQDWGNSIAKALELL